jgi:hypothetical protein
MSENMNNNQEKKPYEESVIFPSVIKKPDNRELNKNESFERFIKEMEIDK